VKSQFKFSWFFDRFSASFPSKQCPAIPPSPKVCRDIAVGKFVTLVKMFYMTTIIRFFLIIWCCIHHPSWSPKIVPWSSLERVFQCHFRNFRKNLPYRKYETVVRSEQCSAEFCLQMTKEKEVI
jgi:hypothetical protein